MMVVNMNMKISYRPLPFHMMKLEFEDTRKRSRTTICESNQSHMQYDLCVCEHVHAIAGTK